MTKYLSKITEKIKKITKKRPTLWLGLGELYRGLDLGQHGAGGELPLCLVLAGFLRGQMVQPLLIGLAEIDGNLFHSGEDDESVRIQLLRQKL